MTAHAPARSHALVITLLALFASLGACVGHSAPPREPAPSAWREWAVASSAAERLVADGRASAADSTLADFVRRWPGTPEAEQGTWLRLGYQAERAEDSASTALLVARIDSLLSAAPASARRGELLTLRRAAMLTQQLRTQLAQARADRDAAVKARSDEVDKLKAELENVKAELDRVRNRVTRRRP